MALVVPTGITGYSGFWNHTGSSTGTYTMRYARNSQEYNAAVALGKRGFRKYRAQMKALNGVAPGASTVDSYKRVQGVTDQSNLGGTRPIQTVSNVTTTTTGMRDAINSRVYDRMVGTMTMPVDLSGNGGGNKVGR